MLNSLDQSLPQCIHKLVCRAKPRYLGQTHQKPSTRLLTPPDPHLPYSNHQFTNTFQNLSHRSHFSARSPYQHIRSFARQLCQFRLLSQHRSRPHKLDRTDQPSHPDSLGGVCGGGGSYSPYSVQPRPQKIGLRSVELLFIFSFLTN